MPLRKGEFRINCCSEHHKLLSGTEIRVLILYIFYLIWKDFGTNVHITLLSSCELRAKFGHLKPYFTVWGE